MSDKVRELVEIPQQFIRDGSQFLTRCTKPSDKEFSQICKAVGVGFAVMGFIGYFVKLIHIPINNILVYVHNYYTSNSSSSTPQQWRCIVEAVINRLYFKIIGDPTSALSLPLLPCL
ncbi:hypothetical protein C8F04DRAFT_1254178 [Mycena alexandri]|uniref:Uncharacterized protein n=1 Tax=Mycena alexandri TaxID=1745969 RepID=A0AAD6XA29_9AGAR|nr:hypothetical protein C8F04DRAFT_1254178 [Mycena alexandri]